MAIDTGTVLRAGAIFLKRDVRQAHQPREYLGQPKTEIERDCALCGAIRAGPEFDHSNLILVRNRFGVIAMDEDPCNAGTLLIAPLGHYATPKEVNQETARNLMHLVDQGLEILVRAVRPKSYNTQSNQGPRLGAGSHEHWHIRILPHWGMETNYLTAFDEWHALTEGPRRIFERLCLARDQLINYGVATATMVRL